MIPLPKSDRKLSFNRSVSKRFTFIRQRLAYSKRCAILLTIQFLLLCGLFYYRYSDVKSRSNRYNMNNVDPTTLAAQHVANGQSIQGLRVKPSGIHYKSDEFFDSRGNVRANHGTSHGTGGNSGFAEYTAHLSVVLPTHCSRFAMVETTLKSMTQFIDDNTFDELIIVTPQECPIQLKTDVSKLFWKGVRNIFDEQLTAYFVNTPLYHRFWLHESIYGESETNYNPNHHDSWNRQMILKLAVSYIVQSDFYLLMDDDVVTLDYANIYDFLEFESMKPHTHSRSNPASKSKSQQNKKYKDRGHDHDSMDTVMESNVKNGLLHHHHNTGDKHQVIRANWVYDTLNWKTHWYDDSAKMLGAEHCLNMSYHDLTFGVTPTILNKNVAMDALQRLSRVTYFDDYPWWTEYAVYSVTLCLRGDFDLHYSNHFEKTLYQRYATELAIEHEAIDDIGYGLSIMRKHADFSIFLILQDGAVQDSMVQTLVHAYGNEQLTDILIEDYHRCYQCLKKPSPHGSAYEKLHPLN